MGVALMMAAGCSVDPAGDRGSATVARATRPAAGDSLVRSSLPAAVWAARDAIAALFVGGESIMVERSSGRFEVNRRLIAACRLTICGASATRLGGGQEEMIRDYLNGAGWKPDITCEADGPDGTRFGMHRGGVFCVVLASWDGGDDSDSTYVPSPDYEVVIDCLVDTVKVCPGVDD